MTLLASLAYPNKAPSSRQEAGVEAIVIHQYGPPEVLRYEEVPDPIPGPGEIRIAVHAATVDRVLDVAVRRGAQGQRGIALPLFPVSIVPGSSRRIG